MDSLIKVNYEGGQPTVSARDLYEKVGTKERFVSWFERQLQFGFEVNRDYLNPQKVLRVQIEGNREVKREVEDYDLSIEMAKEICMIQKNEKAREIRKYLIKINDAWNTPEQVMARALKLADQTIARLKTDNAVLQKEVESQKQIIGELKPKADYTDLILNNTGLVTITQIAKDYGMSGQKMNDLLHKYGIQYKQSGQWLLYKTYHDKGYTHSTTVNITRADGSPDVKMNTKWTQKRKIVYL